MEKTNAGNNDRRARDSVVAGNGRVSHGWWIDPFVAGGRRRRDFIAGYRGSSACLAVAASCLFTKNFCELTIHADARRSTPDRFDHYRQ